MHWITGPFSDALRAMVSVDVIYFALAAMGMNVQFGYAGLLNFGQAAFMAAGAYGLGMTAQYFAISMWWGFGIGLGFAIVLGLLMGVPTLRLRADYLAIVTIAAAEIVRLVVRSVQYKPYFGGSDGINNFSQPFRDTNPLNPGAQYALGPFKYQGLSLWVMIVGWILVALVSLFVWQLMRSPWGRVIKAIREDEEAVRSLGKNVYSYKMQALVLGGVIGVFAGFVLALDRGSVQPDNYSRDVTFYVLTALVLGGLARVSGSVVGPMMFWFLLVFFESFLREIVGDDGKLFPIVSNASQIGQFRFMLIGIMLMVLMVFRPQGLFGSREEMTLDAR
ncbi:MAG: branched-chain amino acid ABC transporter permease [Ilumatobacteraceae bacterium]